MSSRPEDSYDNFCVHPFVKMFVSTQSQMRACCDSQQTISPELSVLKNSVENIWNGETFQKLRQSFNERKMPSDICRICIEREKQGMISSRIYENKKFNKLTEYYYNNPTTIVPSPLSLSLRMSNECNLQCVMCRPQLSNQIAKNMLQFNQTNTDNLYSTEWPVEEYSSSDFNYNEKFVQHIVDHAEHTEEIWAVGGEPFVMKGFDKLIKKLVDADKSSHITLHIISNGTVIKESFIEQYLTKFKKVILGISLDATEDILEYVRYPSVWSVLQDKIIRINKIARQFPQFSLNLEPTMQLLNIKGLPKLLDFANTYSIAFDLTVLDTPEPLRFSYCPIEERQKIYNEITDSIKQLQDKELSENVEWHNWLINEPTKIMDSRTKKYFQHMVQYFDATRPKKFLDIYPEYDHLLQ